jgi:hypothetical protein
MDNPIDQTQRDDGDEVMESEQDRQHFDKEFMKAYIEDLKERGELLTFKSIQQIYMPAIPATWKAEIGGSVFEVSPGKSW